MIADAGAATRPLDRASSQRIARAFLPQRAFGNRWDYYYAKAKLGSDPLYRGALDALRGSDAPVLDLGCGLGLLAHALRADGQGCAYRGVDSDAGKIVRAERAAATAELQLTRFEVVDLAQTLPSHRGSVALLDVLQYLSTEQQAALLERTIAMLAPGARLVIRTGLDDGTRRGHITRRIDRFANAIGWIHALPKAYPSEDGLRTSLHAAGLSSTFSPMYGNTPFNNWLVVAQRD